MAKTFRISETKSKEKSSTGRVIEGKGGDKHRIPVVIIGQGLGNLADRNYYTREAILSGPSVYEGKKAYIDHPTASSMIDQPGRSVKEICGHYENVVTKKNKEGLLELCADFVVMASRADIVGEVQHAVEYKKKYPDKDFIGISINGDGEGIEMGYEEFVKVIKPSPSEMVKIKQVEGQAIYVITKFTDAVSADLVTEAGARGRILTERAKKQTERDNLMKLTEYFTKFLAGAEKGDEKEMTEAGKKISGMLQSSDEDDKMEAAEAAEASKALLQAKKESKKTDDESDEDYEARSMKSALKKMKAEKKEKKEKEAAEAKEKADKDAKETAEAKEAAAKADKEKKEAKKEDDDDGDADEKAKAEKKKEKKKESEEPTIAELIEQVATLTKRLDTSEASGTRFQKEATEAKVKLGEKERLEAIDEVLRESGLPSRVTKQIKPLLIKARNEKEMKEIVEGFKTAHEELLESELIVQERGGFPAAQASGTTENNDDCF